MFGLASLCGVAGLLAAETTATFVGPELRFSIMLAAQIGALAWLAANACADEPTDASGGALATTAAPRLEAVPAS
jgi:hypothetical protein